MMFRKRTVRTQASLGFVSCAYLLSSASLLSSQEQPKALTLEASVATAWQHNPASLAARFAREGARIEADREKPRALPTLEVVASGTVQGPRVTFPRPDDSLATVLPEETGRLDLIVAQTLYHAGGRAALQRYRAQSTLADLDYRRALADIARTTRRSYVEVLRSESGLRAAQDGLEAAQQYERKVRQRIDAGQAKPVDTETAAAQTAEAQSQLVQAEGGLALARMAFNRVLGRPLTTPVVLEPLADLPSIPDSPDKAMAAALANRVELAELDQSHIAAQAGMSLARSQSQPDLSVRGQLSEQTPSAFLHEHYAAATLELRWPLLDSGKTRQDIRAAQAQAQKIEADREDARQGILLEVMQAWQKMREARSRIDLASVQRHGVEATAQVAQTAYELGRSTAGEVQSAYREVRLAREREVQALYDLQLAAVDFAHAQGETVPPIASRDDRKPH